MIKLIRSKSRNQICEMGLKMIKLGVQKNDE